MKLLALGLVGIKLASGTANCDPACAATQHCMLTADAGDAADAGECKDPVCAVDCTTAQVCTLTAATTDDAAGECINKVASATDAAACTTGQLVHSMNGDEDVWTCEECGDWKKQAADKYDECVDDAEACDGASNPCEKDSTCDVGTKTCVYKCEWNQSFTDPGAVAFDAATHCTFNKDACDEVKNTHYSTGCTPVQKCTATKTTATCENDAKLVACNDACTAKKAFFKVEDVANLCCTEKYNKDETCTAPKDQTAEAKKDCEDEWKKLSVVKNDECAAWEEDHCDGSMSIAFGMVTFAMMFLF